MRIARPGNVPFIDGLRGLMAIWVFVFHANIAVAGGIPIPSGATAVDIFMLISGFLMVYQCRGRQSREPWGAPVTWLRFLMRRFFRLAPLYYVALTIALFCGSRLWAMQQEMETVFRLPWADLPLNDPSKRDLTATNILLHISFLYGFFPAYASNNLLPDWSLALEMQFYAMFPFIALLLKRARYAWLVTAGTISVLVSSKLFGVYITGQPKLLGLFPQPTILALKINCFVVGILIAEAYHCRAEPSYVPLLVAAIALAFYNQALLFSIAAVCVVLLTMERATWSSFGVGLIVDVTDKLLSSRIAKHAGDMSYGIYLFHMLLLVPTVNVISQYAPIRDSSGYVRLASALVIAGVGTYLVHSYALNSGALSGNMRKGTVSLTIWCIVSGA